jgi:hypothetical protein
MQRSLILSTLPIPVAEGSKARVWGRLCAGNSNSNSAGGIDVWVLRARLLPSAFASSRSPVKRIPTNCGCVSVRDL